MTHQSSSPASVGTTVVADGLTVGEVAEESGVAPSAVRFYEKYGVVTARRTSGNQRRFDDSAACRIQVAKVAKRVGLSVREISDLFASLPEEPQPEDWGVVTEQLVATAEQRVAELKEQLAALDSDTRLCVIGYESSS
ncbi:MAG TPA: MerR family DNA-binding transcriptional regulator [Candidatus Corynebacterium avicola]|uniref:MerR family DNA-binding transcriptional regulator n=1 Tax=Candidatus Corynebacterium avicola TaxID=2838527 RepID=A0A9D1RP41_9CORY|nr:MerR family DNA-binding transcriptional regulator [Candidatus Corynebacterium avicola]